jgi:small multidrug resistance pump
MELNWLYLFGAILFEVAGTMSMKFSEGFTKLLPSVMIFVCYAVAFTFVTFAIRKIEISVAYTVWSGVGTTLVAMIGILYFGEQATALKLASIALVIAGVVGLKISAG